MKLVDSKTFSLNFTDCILKVHLFLTICQNHLDLELSLQHLEFFEYPLLISQWIHVNFNPDCVFKTVRVVHIHSCLFYFFLVLHHVFTTNLKWGCHCGGFHHMWSDDIYGNIFGKLFQVSSYVMLLYHSVEMSWFFYHSDFMWNQFWNI